MIPKECKRLAEVDFPIAVVSRHSAREKSIRHGHPSTLHLWWARRPLAACRAMLLALLLPDPCDPNCPADFKDKARNLLKGFPGIRLEASELSLRRAILHFIGDFANWDNAAKPRYLEVGRGLVKAAHGEETPLVVDPFAGGGSIPLEALRLGCEAFASDLNPVACLILKVMLEDIPHYGAELADELRKVGSEIKKQAEKELAQYYPSGPDGTTPIGYLWARTVRCESPGCSAEIPLLRSLWLCKKPSRLRALRYQVKRPTGKSPYLEFEVFQPDTEKKVSDGTIARGNATCPACNTTLAVNRVRTQLRQLSGGADVIFDSYGNRVGGARLLAVVTLKDEAVGRHYRIANERDYSAVWNASKAIAKLAQQRPGEELSIIPDELLPPQGTLGFRVQLYGMTQWGNLFTARQKLALVTFARLVSALSYESGILRSTARLLAASLSRLADKNASLSVWNQIGEKIEHVFGRQALPIVWDFAEVAIFSESTGNLQSGIDLVHEVVEHLASARPAHGQTQLADSCNFPLPDDAAKVWFIDPPYYDAVPYADLSDFFFVWLKRALPGEPLFRDPFDPANRLTPKTAEIVQDEVKNFKGEPKGRVFFELSMARAFAEGRRVLDDDGIGSVVFAHKTTEGWEALLSGMIKSGWTITGSWPISTERPGRLRAQESAALATSVHLVSRPRANDAPVGEWSEVFRELPSRIGEWMEYLSSKGVRGADLVFACIGPAMEVYSRYSRVEDAEGRPVPLGGDPEESEPHKRGFLAYVWEIVGRTALGQVLGTAEARARNGAAGALEEDSRLTALFLWTHQSTTATDADAEAAAQERIVLDSDESDDDEDTGGKAKKGLTLIYDVVRRFAQPLGIHLDTWDGRIIESKKGIVRLLPVRERAETLLGEDGASGAADLIERSRGGEINYEFAFMEKERPTPRRTRGKKSGKSSGIDEAPTVAPGMTTLDRVHIAMLLQAAGKANALRTMLKAEAERGQDFVRLANALSALYPRDSEEKRLVDAMLLAMPK
jgi:putative DNA methylase